MTAETILVVDDASEIQSFVRKSVLEPAGYRVLSAMDSNAGLRMAIETRPDLFLFDINMPGKSGLELLKELRKQGHNQPAIVMTSFGSEDVILLALRLGAKDFLEKPFTAEEVLKAVASALAEARWQRERAEMLQALTNANHRLTEQVQNWAVLNGIGQTITSTLDETDVLRRLVAGINQLLRVEAGSLYVIEEGTGELKLKITLRGSSELIQNISLQPGQGIAGWVAQHNQPAFVPDVTKDQRFFPGIDEKTGFLTRSILAVPFSTRGKVLGVIQVINPCGAKPQFDQTDLSILQVLAASVAVAVENARLHAKVRQTVTLATLKQTVVALSHYINNSLTIFAMLAEALVAEIQKGHTLSQKQLLEWAGTIHSETARIAKIMVILNQVTRPRVVTYQGNTQMIDIDAELRAALEHVQNELPLPNPD